MEYLLTTTDERPPLSYQVTDQHEDVCGAITARLLPYLKEYRCSSHGVILYVFADDGAAAKVLFSSKSGEETQLVYPRGELFNELQEGLARFANSLGIPLHIHVQHLRNPQSTQSALHGAAQILNHLLAFIEA